MLKLLALIGSVFVKQDGETGKVRVAALPTGALLYILSGVACYTQDDEPFSICVERLIPFIGGTF